VTMTAGGPPCGRWARLLCAVQESCGERDVRALSATRRAARGTL